MTTTQEIDMASRPKKEGDLQAKIIVRAWKDPRFKEKLLKTPRAAFKEMGADIPETVQIKIIEDKPNAFTFVIPAPVLEVKQMSDQELEKVAGGTQHRLTIHRGCTGLPGC
jgi:hypothetical protein